MEPTDNTDPVSTDGVDDNGTPPGADEQLGAGGKKALEAERQTVKELRAEVKALKDAAKAPEPKSEPEGNDLADRIAALEQQLADEKKAAEAAQVEVLRVKLGAALPPELVELLTGTTEDEIRAQVDKLAPLVKTSPQPNPQQGTPPGNTGGSVSSGRDRYKAAHPS